MKKIPAVSIVIPTLNEEKYLPILLKSLSKIDAPLEIIIVDGGSTDETQKVARDSKIFFTHRASLEFLSLSERGISLQRNTGAQRARNELILFCDADIIAPSTDEHRYIISEFVKNNYAVASGKVVNRRRLRKTVSP